MSTIKAIRDRLGLTQAALAEHLGCTQGNIWHYERQDKPQTVPPEVAKKLIVIARDLGGVEYTMDQVYGLTPLDQPKWDGTERRTTPRTATAKS